MDGDQAGLTQRGLLEGEGQGGAVLQVADADPDLALRGPGFLADHHNRAGRVGGTDPIGTLRQPGRATVQGRLRAAEVRPVQHNNVLACEVADSTGELTAVCQVFRCRDR